MRVRCLFALQHSETFMTLYELSKVPHGISLLLQGALIFFVCVVHLKALKGGVGRYYGCLHFHRLTFV